MFEDDISEIISNISNSYGDKFFNAIALSFYRAIKANYIFISELSLGESSAKTLVFVDHGKLAENFEYDLHNTPCALASSGNEVCLCIPEDAQRLFPRDDYLVDLNVNAYIGTPLYDSNRRVIGLLVALFEQPIANRKPIETLFELFSGRVSAEIERQAYAQYLESLNHTLEERVKHRTQDLNTALQELQDAQQKLIESEKIAALGDMVAGVAHEINTPLGVAITSSSYIQEEVSALKQAVTDKSITESQLNTSLRMTSEALNLLNDNLLRTRDLVRNFKLVASATNFSEPETINLRLFYNEIIASMAQRLQTKRVKVSTDLPDINILTNPGSHAYILTNLIQNSVQHGFSSVSTSNLISITGQVQDNTLSISYRDNGQGIDEKCHQKIFEPFFTTDRKSGSSGLGMTIIYNQAIQALKGEIEQEQPEQGYQLTFRCPV